MGRAESVFGTGQVEFTRVLDAAGVLKHHDRVELMRFLEDLERNLPPVALGVYITDHGQARELRPHAHWILNHARIHHPSFGKREQNKAYEDAKVRERLREKGDPIPAHAETGVMHMLRDCWDGVKGRVRDIFHPYSTPAKMEWAFILVMDVQLEMACFSWGYRLDPYINPEKINRAIVSARLQFRERATVQGIKKVMKNAVRIIATDSRAVMRSIRREGRVGKPVGVETMPALRKGANMLMCAAAVSLLAADSASAAPATATTSSKKPAATAKARTSTAKQTARKPAVKPAARQATAPAKARTATKPPATTKPAASTTRKTTATKKPATSTARKSTASSTRKPVKRADKKDDREERKASVGAPEKVRDETEPLIVPARLPEEKPAAPRLPDAPLTPHLVDDDIAEDVDDGVEEVDVEETPPPSVAKNVDAASFDSAPRWKPEDYALLMKGSLQTGYTALFPAKGEAAPSPYRTTGNARPAPVEESDTVVLAKYCEEYTKPSPSGLIDPQGLLSTMERDDVEHVLREINGNGRFRIYTAIIKAGQEMPRDLAVGTLATAVAQPCEYAVLLLYHIGSPGNLELGYQEIKADDTQRHEWLNKVRTAAAEQGSGVDGLLAAMRQVSANTAPLAASFTPLTPENTSKAPKLEIQYKQVEEKKEPGLKEKITETLKDPENASYLPYIGGVFALLALVAGVVLYRRRHSPNLLDTTPDWRLSAPYGAGVSRLVKYLEGKESEKEKTLF